MDDRTRSALAELNRAFYAEFAGDFARTRRGWPAGFDLILPYIRPAANVLDVGCGNGRLAAFLTERGWRGCYLGVDSSPGLLAAAGGDAGQKSMWSGGGAVSDAAASTSARARFARAELLDPGWPALLGDFRPDAITCLAVLHHIPGAAYRARLVAECAGLLQPGGVLILSAWQFLAAPRLRARILPWAAVDLRDEDVDPGDYLIAWGAGAAGKRYCAAIDAEALCELAENAGLSRVETIYADGHEGNLNLYEVFRLTAR